jgi:hypothetical protein
MDVNLLTPWTATILEEADVAPGRPRDPQTNDATRQLGCAVYRLAYLHKARAKSGTPSDAATERGFCSCGAPERRVSHRTTDVYTGTFTARQRARWPSSFPPAPGRKRIAMEERRKSIGSELACPGRPREGRRRSRISAYK